MDKCGVVACGATFFLRHCKMRAVLSIARQGFIVLLMTKDDKAENKTGWDQYHEYESLDKILTAQHLRSDDAGDHAHDEMLFIVYHQVCELWFKQILFELDDIQNRFDRDIVDDRDMQPIIAYLERIVTILKMLVQMIDVLETMPPQSFIDFREHLSTASGFQSWQFRLIEVRLGLRREDRIPVFHGEFDADLRDQSKKAIADAENKRTLFDQLDRWLARTPFVQRDDYDFWREYRDAVHNMLDQKAEMAKAAFNDDALDQELASISRGKAKFDGIFEPENAENTKNWRMSWQALQAALFITIYRTEPILQSPHRLLSCVMDIDELFARWRYRHALMVQRMMGANMGSGGSGGYSYLMETLEKHRIFGDIFALSTYLIPSNSLPALPKRLREKMGYRYVTDSDKAA